MHVLCGNMDLSCMDVNKVVICYWVSSHFQTVAVNIKRLMLCITGLYQPFTSSLSLSPCLLFSTPITLCHKNFVRDPPRTMTVLKFSLPSRSLSQNPGSRCVAVLKSLLSLIHCRRTSVRGIVRASRVCLLLLPGGGAGVHQLRQEDLLPCCPSVQGK